MASYPSDPRQRVKSLIQDPNAGFPLQELEKKSALNSDSAEVRVTGLDACLPYLRRSLFLLTKMCFLRLVSKSEWWGYAYLSSEIHLTLMAPDSLFIQTGWDWSPQRRSQKKLPELVKIKTSTLDAWIFCCTHLN